MPAWGGYTNGEIPIPALVYVDGVYLEPEFGARVSCANEDLRNEGYWIVENEGDRPYGVEADEAIGRNGGDPSTTSTGGSNQWYQWGRYKLWLATGGAQGTPSAADPTGGGGTSEHGWAMADDSNSNSIARRKAISATYGCNFPISSETWHRQPSAPLSGATAARVETRKRQLLQNLQPSPAQEEDIVASLADLQKAIHDEVDPILKQTTQLVQLPDSQKGFADQIDGQYVDVLGRHADPGGLGMFIGLMTNSSWTIAQVRQSLLDSDEYAARWIGVQYSQLLGRSAGASEVSGWVQFKHAGHTLDDVATQIKASDEFKTKHPQ
ncbi:hypothetical protein [Subtercola sp. YIM 133946]|uniref:hypothetical protein n=1 Tax=Subtercola sp. YIM 133946 TaxID=3118909 RepID=UPI002F9294B1